MALVSKIRESFVSYQLHSVVRYVWMDRKTRTWKKKLYFLIFRIGVQVSLDLMKSVETNHCYPRLSCLTHWIPEFFLYMPHTNS